MARKRRVSKRRSDLTPEQIAWLNGDYGNAGFFQFTDATDDFWFEHSERVVAEHVADFPGTRPYHWWRLEAPRMKTGYYPGCFYDGKLCEPRKRLGGIGTPQHECLGCVPCFEYGLPVVWLTSDLASLYRGTAKDVHGQPIFPEYFSRPFTGVAIDPNDPPRFESQASYLKRHGLFMPGEGKRLSKTDFEQEEIIGG